MCAQPQMPMAAEGGAACRCESEERRAAEAEARDDSQRRGLQPTLAQVGALAAEAQELPVDPQLKARLEDLVAAGEDWEARASGVLHPKKVHLGSWLALLQRPVLLSRP